MSEAISSERIAAIEAHLLDASEFGMTVGDVYARDLLAEVKRLRAAVPSWADLRDVLADLRYAAATDVEITNAVMGLITGEADRG